VEWVDTIEADPRMSLRYGDAAATGLPDASVGFVNLCLVRKYCPRRFLPFFSPPLHSQYPPHVHQVLHELPRTAADAILSEAYRILAPGGTLGIMEMDPSSPGYIKLMSNPFFFSILRSTEPYLGDYFGEVRSRRGSEATVVIFPRSRFASSCCRRSLRRCHRC
jgi:hypothetical protein